MNYNPTDILSAEKSWRTQPLNELPARLKAALSARLGRDQSRYHVAGAGDVSQASNASHKMDIAFATDHIRVRPQGDAGSVYVDMSLVSWGRGGDIRQLLGAQRDVDDNCVAYRRGMVTEWYINGPLGLEQGFTLEEPPDGESGELVLEIQLAGSLIPQLMPGGEGIALNTPDGDLVMSYGGLVAWDAEGRDVPVRFSLQADRLRLHVDDAEAVYPLVIDPWIQAGYLKTSGTDADDLFGYSVAISGDTAVVGARGVGSNTGAVYIFERDQNGAGRWGFFTELTVNDAATGDRFGYSVAISGDTVIVGAYDNDDDGSASGSAYIFERDQGGADNWGQVTIPALTASDAAAGDWFGYSVGISGDTAVVGARGEDSSTGAAYIFERDEGGADNWGEVTKLTASDGATGDIFGRSVAIAGDTAVIGASGDDDNGSGAGAAYIFDRDQGGAGMWGEVTKITASDGAASDVFGVSVAIAGDTVVVGAYGDDDYGTSSGSAYVFERDQGGADNWGEVTKLNPVPDDADEWDGFGESVAIAGDTIVIGATSTDDGDHLGAAYVFDRDWGGADNWGQVQKLTASNAAAGDEFGISVAIAGSTVVAGAWLSDIKGAFSGAATVFESKTGNQVAVLPDFDIGTSVEDIIGDLLSHSQDVVIYSCNPIDLRDGNKILAEQDLRVHSPAGLLAFSRSYSQDKQDDPDFQFMGLGWLHNHFMKVSVTGSSPDREAVVRLSGGGSLKLVEQSADHFVAAAGSTALMDYDSSADEYTLTAQDKSTYILDGTSGLIKSRHFAGGEVWTYSYNSGDLSQVADDYGRALQFSYVDNSGQYDDGQLWRVGDHTASGLDTGSPSGRYVEFSYTPEKDDGVTVGSPKALLAGVVDVRGNTWTYDYYGQHAGEDDSEQLNFLTKRLSPSVDADGDGAADGSITLESLSYTLDSGVITDINQERGDGLLETDFAIQPGSSTTTTETVAGKTTTHEFADDGGDSGVYLGTDNPASEGGEQAFLSSYRPFLQTDARGNETLLEWSPDGRQLHRVTDAAGSETRFVYNGDDTWDYTLDADGRKRVYTYEDIERAVNGGMEADSDWTDISGAAPTTNERSTAQVDSGTYARRVVTSALGQGIEGNSWDLVAGRAYAISARVYVVSGSVKMQVSGTDAFDDVSTGTGSWETLSVSYIPTASQPTRHLQFVGDDSSAEFFVDTVSILETAREPITIQVYDDLAETTLLAQQEFVYDAKRRVTSEQQIDPSDGTTVLREVTRSYYSSGDGEGLLQTVTQEDIGGANDQTTTYTYDSAGRVIQTSQNSNFGNCSITRTIYDAAGSVVASICNYDAEAAGVTSFDNNNPPEDAADAVLLRQETTDPDVNRVTTHEYDAMGRRVKTTTEAGETFAQTSLTLYDSLDRVVRRISNFVDDSYDPPGDWVFESGLWKDGPSGTAIDHGGENNQNIISDTTYNQRDLVRLNRDPLGSVTLYGYDDADRLVKTVRSAATPGYDNDYSGDPDLSAYSVSSEPDEDLITASQYDANGNLIKTVDVLGNTTLTGYDALNRAVKTVRNAGDPDYDLDADPDLSAYVANASADQDMVGQTEYDAMGRVIRSIDALGNVTLFGYDELGRQVKAVRSAGDPGYDIASDPDLSGYSASGNADEDIISQSVYADDGRVQSALDVLSTETRFVYDGLGRQTRTIANYADNGEDPVDWLWDDVTDNRWEESDGTAIDHDENDQNVIAETIYDSDGRVEVTRDVEGKMTYFVYDDVGRRTRTVRNYVDNGEDLSLWLWDGATDFRWEESDGTAIDHGTDNDENIISDTTYDDRGRVQQTRDPRGNLSYFVYDTIGRRVRTVLNYVDNGEDPSLWVWDDVTDNRWEESDGTAIDHGGDNDQNIISDTVYDLAGRVVSSFDAAHNEARFVYDGLGRRIRSIQNYVDNGEDPALWVWDTTDGRWEESDGTAIDHGADNDENIISDTVYNGAGQITSTRDARGTVTAFSYDLAGRRKTTTRALGSSLEITSSVDYDKAGRVLGRSNGPGHTMVFQLDKLGRVTQVTDAEGNTSSTTYAKDGRVIATTDPEGSVIQNRYDSLRRLRRMVAGFNDNGEDPSLWVWDDVTDNRWEESDGTAIDHGADNDQNIIVNMAYDIMGRRISQRDPRGYLTAYQYDQLGRRTDITNPLSQSWDTAYVNLSSGGSKVTLTDPLTNEAERVFDRLGRLKEINYNHASTPDVAFAYDLLGNRLSMSEDDGSLVRETFYGYDAARRLTQVDFDTDGDTNIDETVTYEYDAGGLRTKMTLPGSLEIVYQYDAQGRLISLEDWDNQQSSYSYDQAGRLDAVLRPNGLISRYDYDRNGRLLDLNHVDTDGQSLRRFRYTLDGRGNRVQLQEVEPGSSAGETIAADDDRIQYLKGSWSTEGAYEASSDFGARFRLAFWGREATITFGSNPDGGIVDIYADQNFWGSIDTYAAGSGDEVVTIPFYRDTFHILEVRNRSDRNLASSGRTLRLKQIAVATDLALQTIQYTYDVLARLQAADYYEGDDLSATPTREYAYAYDPAGNRTRQVETVMGSPTTTNYTYNAANQLTSDGTKTYTYDANGNLTGDGTNTYTWDRANRLLTYQGSTYAYDGLGQRVSQEVSSVVTEYLRDVQPGLWKVIATDDGSNVNRYLHDITGLAEHEDNSGDWHWPALDALGTVRQVYDDTLTEVYAADRAPYGDLIASTGSNPTPFEYTGEPEDPNGLLHLRARYYDPNLAVFNSLDPLETANRYAYVGGNPIDFADPSGKSRACSPSGSGTVQQSPIPTPYIPGPYVNSSRVPFCLEVCGLLSEPQLSDCFVQCYSEPVNFCNSMAPRAEPYKSDAFVGCINGDFAAYSSAWLASPGPPPSPASTPSSTGCTNPLEVAKNVALLALIQQSMLLGGNVLLERLTGIKGSFGVVVGAEKVFNRAPVSGGGSVAVMINTDYSACAIFGTGEGGFAVSTDSVIIGSGVMISTAPVERLKGKGFNLSFEFGYPFGGSLADSSDCDITAFVSPVPIMPGQESFSFTYSYTSELVTCSDLVDIVLDEIIG